MSPSTMPFIRPAFHRYVDRAREGRTSLWALAAGIVVITLCWVLTTVAALIVGFVLSGALDMIRTGGDADPWVIVTAFFNTPFGIACTLASFCGISFGVFLALRFLHRRRFGTVLGEEGRLDRGAIWRGALAALIASALAEAGSYAFDPVLTRGPVPLGAWLLMLAPMVALLFVQISAEELAFRGYLLQNLAARFRSPLIWAIAPALVFTLMHWDATALPAMNAAGLLTIAAFALSATLLVVRTGNLGAAMGAHLGLNAFGIFVVSHAGWLNGAALWHGRPLEAQDWTSGDALAIGALGVASFGLMLALLLHPRSPLAVERDRV